MDDLITLSSSDEEDSLQNTKPKKPQKISHVISLDSSDVEDCFITDTPQSNPVTMVPSLVSSDEEDCVITDTPQPRQVTMVESLVTISPNNNVTLSPINMPGASRPTRRINPIKISNVVTNRADSIEMSGASDILSLNSLVADNDFAVTQQSVPLVRADKNSGPSPKRPRIDNNQKAIINIHYKDLMEACRVAESSDEMTTILTKLERYYQQAHPDYVNSEDFHKLVNNLTNDIKKRSTLASFVYIQIANLLEELKMNKRRRVEDANQLPDNTEKIKIDEEKNKRIQQLNESLRKLQKIIQRNEEAEVDLKDEVNSNYLHTDRFKQRAIKIYEKICNLTGASCNAQRIIKKPIKFQGTDYRKFNQTLEKFVNKTNEFPDIFDVLRIMNHCNTKYSYQLSATERRDAAQSAFTQIGIQLQKRRRQDLYETVQYYTTDDIDPAREDPTLNSQLQDNRLRFGNRIKEVIDTFTRRQSRKSNEEKESSTSRPDDGEEVSSSESSEVPISTSVGKGMATQLASLHAHVIVIE